MLHDMKTFTTLCIAVLVMAACNSTTPQNNTDTNKTATPADNTPAVTPGDETPAETQPAVTPDPEPAPATPVDSPKVEIYPGDKGGVSDTALEAAPVIRRRVTEAKKVTTQKYQTDKGSLSDTAA